MVHRLRIISCGIKVHPTEDLSGIYLQGYEGSIIGQVRLLRELGPQDREVIVKFHKHPSPCKFTLFHLISRAKTVSANRKARVS